MFLQHIPCPNMTTLHSETELISLSARNVFSSLGIILESLFLPRNFSTSGCFLIIPGKVVDLHDSFNNNSMSTFDDEADIFLMMVFGKKFLLLLENKGTVEHGE